MPQDPQFEAVWATGTPRSRGADLPSLTVLRKGVGRPIFWVHWANGNVRSLSNLLGAAVSRPIYGFESRGLRRRDLPLLSVGDMADRYLAELRAAQPDGPYTLVGACSGGPTAYEMAHRLTADGHEIESLTVVNSFRPGTRELGAGLGPADLYDMRLGWLRRWLGVERLRGAERLAMRRLHEMHQVDDDADDADFFWYQLLWAANAFAQENYDPPCYDGPVTLCQLRRHAHRPELSWREIAPESETVLFEADASVSVIGDPRFWARLRPQPVTGMPG